MGDSLTMTYESAGTALWTCRHCGEMNVTHLNEDWVCLCGMGYDGNRRFASGKRGLALKDSEYAA